MTHGSVCIFIRLTQAYIAWQTLKSRQDSDTITLPGFNQTMRESQFFFINFGRSFCNTIRPENVLERVSSHIS
jgi:hypothetical protein